MSDTEKLAEAMKELAAAIKALSDKLPNASFAGGYTVYHQHSSPTDRLDYRSPFYTSGGNQC